MKLANDLPTLLTAGRLEGTLNRDDVGTFLIDLNVQHAHIRNIQWD
jgi:hypothetical protein